MSSESTSSSSSADLDNTMVEPEPSLAPVIPSPQISSSQEVCKTEEFYPTDFSYPMAVCYEYLTLRDNWIGVLPCQWQSSYALRVPISPNYFQKALYGNKNEEKPQLAVMHSEEINLLCEKDQIEGATLFHKLIDLGPKVRSILESGRKSFEYSTDPIEERGRRYCQYLICIETCICEALNAFSAWMKGSVFISVGKFPLQCL